MFENGWSFTTCLARGIVVSVSGQPASKYRYLQVQPAFQ